MLANEPLGVYRSIDIEQILRSRELIYLSRLGLT